MIKLNGQPVTLFPPDREFYYWVQRAVGELSAGLWAEPKFAPLVAPWGCPSAAQLPVPNWPVPPAMRVNSLWWPLTGASRWARGLFLVDEETLDKILPEDSDGTVTLTMGGETKVEKTSRGPEPPPEPDLSVELKALNPRQITAAAIQGTAGSHSRELWLLPCVDQRYGWQYHPISLGEVTKNTTWYDLLQKVETELGLTFERDPIEPAFGNPSVAFWSRRVAPAGELLDAIAASVARRFVVDMEGKLYLLTPDGSEYGHMVEENTWNRISGGIDKEQRGYPETVRLLCPWVESGNFRDGDPFESDYSTGIEGAPEDSVALVQTTMQAVYDSAAPDTPTNIADLDALAAAVGTAVAEWAKKPYRVTLRGIIQWTPRDQDDAVWYQDGALWPIDVDTQWLPGQYAVQTAAMSLPPNMLPRWILAQTPDKEEIECQMGGGAGGTLYRFGLTQELLSSDGDGRGEIKNVWIGDPADIEEPDGSLPTDVRMINTEAGDGSYLFRGEVGACGLCSLANEDLWEPDGTKAFIIIQLQCPPAASP